MSTESTSHKNNNLTNNEQSTQLQQKDQPSTEVHPKSPSPSPKLYLPVNWLRNALHRPQQLRLWRSSCRRSNLRSKSEPYPSKPTNT
eukprot:scaffold43409_cov41-Cyclotella_meneghiniana.AAC.6